MKIIIVEGIDRVGKTTLISKLQNELKLKCNKDVVVFKDVYEAEMFGGWTIYSRDISTEKLLSTFNFLKSVESLDLIVILDRFHLSEYVYGKVNRGYVNNTMFKVDDLLSNMSTDLILVTPTDITKSSEEHGCDLTENEKEYKQFFDKTKIKNKYMCTYCTMDDIITLEVQKTKER